MTVGNAIKQGIFIVGAKRTAFGTFGGTLKNVSPTELQVHAANAALVSANLKPTDIDSVCIGNVLSCSGTDTPYVARHVALKLGADIGTPALTVNRLCGSGFQSIINGCQEILAGDAEVVVTGGTDNMSLAPYAIRDTRFGTRLGVDMKMEDMLWAALTDAHIGTPMGVTAENLAVKYNLTRQEVDEFAHRSQQLWVKGSNDGMFDDEIVPITVKKGRKTVEFAVDEHPKPETTMEQMSKLPTVFKKDGVVTAGSASGICDGAASVVIASESAISRLGLKPLARILGYGVSGCDPHIMGIGPVPAIRSMCDKTGISLSSVAEVDINEAFAAQALAVARELEVPMEKFNTCGGAVALGHPLAASGSRITAHLTHKLRRKHSSSSSDKVAVGGACIGGGQGVCVMIERCDD